ncbi:MAG: hypothetical protein VYE81_03085, partial [Planctomycetota bacterium]|nr:hypothetical protein [Planctomycetota bacterium]
MDPRSLRSREVTGRGGPRLARSSRGQPWIELAGERVWLHRRTRCGFQPRCGSVPSGLWVTLDLLFRRLGVVVRPSLAHETALHALARDGDAEGIRRVLRRGWIWGMELPAETLGREEEALMAEVARGLRRTPVLFLSRTPAHACG